MCSINHDLKAIFIHVHKTGGTYISYMLHKYYGFKNFYIRRPDHDSFCFNKKKITKYLNFENRIHGVLNYYKSSAFINKKMGMNSQKWNSYYKFCFIRNPYDKIVSAWYHLNRFNIPFTNFLNLYKVCNDVEYMHVFMPQVRNMINEKGKINLNYIGKFENLEEDFQIILKNIGIKNIIHDIKEMNKRNHLPFFEYYNDQITLDKVNKILKEDFQLLNYNIILKIEDFKNLYHNNYIYDDINEKMNIMNINDFINNDDNIKNDNNINNNNNDNDNDNNNDNNDEYNYMNNNLNYDNMNDNNMNDDNIMNYNDNINNYNNMNDDTINIKII